MHERRSGAAADCTGRSVASGNGASSADKGSAGKQIESHKVSRLKARFLKFVIGAGYADFATVFKIEVYSEGGI